MTWWTAAQQRELARRFQNGERQVYDIVLANTEAMIFQIANRFCDRFPYSDRQTLFDDLVQEGRIGLLRALEGYDTGRKEKFITYAWYWINARMGLFLRSTMGHIRVPNAAHDVHARIRAVEERLAQDLGRSPSLGEVTAASGANAFYVRAARTSFVRVDADFDGGTRADTIPDPNADVEGAGLARIERAELLRAVGRLDCISRGFLVVNFGLDGGQPMTYRKIAKFASIPAGVASILVRQAVEELRGTLTTSFD